MEYNKHLSSSAEAWKRHFKAMAENEGASCKQFYKLKGKHHKTENESRVHVVAETAQMVDQARSEVREEEEDRMP
ncbi:MAG: hypothetical protein V3T88_06705, partial [Nitrosomonadaceae bacterium]